MRNVEPIASYKICYKPNKAYTGKYQVDKIGGGGIHCHVTPQMGGWNRVLQEVERCKAWFNNERIAVEKTDSKGKLVVEIRSTFHDNVLVFVEKFLDGHYHEDVSVCDEKSKVEKPNRAVELKKKIEELQLVLMELEDQEEPVSVATVEDGALVGV